MDDAAPLPPRDYHLVVGPALKTMADMAAARGDPQLYNDMAAMLVLAQLVRGLGHQHGASGTAQADSVALEKASLGACAVVLQEADLAEDQKQDCLWALQAAEQQLQAEGVLPSDSGPALQQAYASLAAGERDAGEKQLTRVARPLVSAIDEWERARANGGDSSL